MNRLAKNRGTTFKFALIAAVGVLIGTTSARALTTYFTDETAWLAAVDGTVQVVTTTASGVALAQEVSAPPATDEDLGAELNFFGSQTGFAHDFRLRTLQPGATFVFNDNTTGSMQDALSVGQIDVFEEDSWQLDLISGPTTNAIAFNYGNNDGPGDTVCVYASDLNASPACPFVPSNTDNGLKLFYGIVSDEPVIRVRFNASPAGDDLGISNFRLVAPNLASSEFLLLDPGLSQEPLLGGSSTAGGLDITLEGSDEGVFTGSYQPLTQQELVDRILEGDLSVLDFALPGDTVQLWDLEYTGVLNGSATMVVGYDESVLLQGLDENSLAIYHFVDGGWVNLSGIVDVVNNTITFQTDSFSPFVLGTVPEPSTAVLLATGLAALALRAQRNAVHQHWNERSRVAPDPPSE